MNDITRAEVCVAACADLFAGAGETLASPMGFIPSLGARLARLTTEPDLLLSDGEAFLLRPDSTVEGWLPYRKVFDVVAHGRRHVVMGANQIDRFGNQNISAIGDHAQPARQLLGFRGAPGNTVNHRTSYWVPRHSPRVFVEAVDVVCGVGYDRATGPFHDVHRVVTNLAVLGFDTPDHAMRLISTHPGVSVDEVRERTSFALVVEDVVRTRLPTAGELELIRTALDSDGRREGEVPS
ncbi:Acyl CoA:acetate/3-ketoacid CoA transferase, beta subunit [Lentzea xinjiangensis]|uniref:Acyl CoA:acetate/3-ketoacid CoA transferase, beta subunit n=1 Tax=Lentzea xinjiangensis TaxID=402600 RepID=A0A1H9VQY6_9PSEU|nr:CoA-transferase [Lentzea xinjiangensis]SES23968.1 Acyl CoA:acetate/3-ketoacid CoA transferase, beta subunit [Lentzea xinjiangensis]